MISPNQNYINQGYASNIIAISGGLDGAKNYPVAGGYTAMMIDEENKMFFIKTNDASGIPKPIRQFKYEEITPKNPGEFDPSQFVTKDDFNTLLVEIKKLQNGQYNKRRNDNGHNETV